MDTAFPPIAWSDALSVGDTTIDEQHRTFIGAVNELVDLIAGRSGRHAIVAHLGRMLRDATMHFAAEEASLERYGIKAAMAHQREHSRIMRGIHDLLIKAGASVADSEVAEHALNIREELLSHFLKFDLKHKSHILDVQAR